MTNLSSKENLIEILEAIKDRVVVTGSYATGKYTEASDIDFFIKEKPEDEIDCEAAFVEDTYVGDLTRYFESLGYEWGSVFVGSFHIDDSFIPLEFSSCYDIDEDFFGIDILGVKMTAARSNHNSEKYCNGEKIRN